jgi:hypothetical protein
LEGFILCEVYISRKGAPPGKAWLFVMGPGTENLGMFFDDFVLTSPFALVLTGFAP